jgi:hypothetical protein
MHFKEFVEQTHGSHFMKPTFVVLILANSTKHVLNLLAKPLPRAIL